MSNFISPSFFWYYLILLRFGIACWTVTCCQQVDESPDKNPTAATIFLGEIRLSDHHCVGQFLTVGIYGAFNFLAMEGGPSLPFPVLCFPPRRIGSCRSPVAGLSGRTPSSHAPRMTNCGSWSRHWAHPTGRRSRSTCEPRVPVSAGSGRATISIPI
jgi:hypothetical protein